MRIVTYHVHILMTSVKRRVMIYVIVTLDAVRFLPIDMLDLSMQFHLANSKKFYIGCWDDER